jgi:hypothetical protein
MPRARVAGRWLRWLWVAGAVQVAGRLVDLRWHAAHPGFERAGDQVQAHWLIWLGVLGGLAAALAGLRQVRDRGLMVVASASVAYAGLAGWHFAEHAAGSDPEIVHVLVGLAWAAIVAGIVDVTVRVLRRRGGSATEESDR